MDTEVVNVIFVVERSASGGEWTPVPYGSYYYFAESAECELRILREKAMRGFEYRVREYRG